MGQNTTRWGGSVLAGALFLAIVPVSAQEAGSIEKDYMVYPQSPEKGRGDDQNITRRAPATTEEADRLIEEQRRMEEIRKKLREDASKRAYEYYRDEAVPLTPEQVLDLRKRTNEMQEATQRPIDPPETLIQTITVDINAKDPTIVYVSKQNASALVYFDQSGAPWPIESVVIGDKTSFAANIIGEMQNVVTVNVIRQFAQGNMLVNLRGLPVPLVMNLVGGEKYVHGRLNIQIPKAGPNAKVQAYVERDIDNAPNELLDVLNGQVPPNAIRRKLIGVQGDAWEVDGDIYLRTSAMLISPAWKRSTNSVTGMRVYRLGPVTNLLFSVDGRKTKASIGERTQVYLNKR